ncbi:hypothetical protein [Sphingobium terrigena]|uniref:hypothetical protein n=1 Tax=Sphingobium terrigena TaxID=2304063 RepID=UPI0011C485F2|nr:hypothetical protein [Sphingobium terrigena]
MSKTPPQLDSIAAAAAAAMDEENNRSPSDSRLDKIEQRLADIEPLLEQAQANSALSTALTNYISDLRDEQKFFNKARYVVGGVALGVIGIISILLFLAIFHWQSPLLKATAPVVAAFIISMLSGMVFIVNSVAKGVFRSTVERHADGFLPPALSEAEKLYSRMTGKVD